MTCTVAPIALVSATRKSTEDDFWGGQMSEIRLADHIDPSSLLGLEARERSPRSVRTGLS